MIEQRLSGPRAENPLGFLTALGVLVTLEDTGRRALLDWQGWTPRILVDVDPATGTETIADPDYLVKVLYQALRRHPGEGTSATARAKKEMEQAKTACKRKRDDIKKRKLDSQAAKEARRHELVPLEEELHRKTAIFKEMLAKSAPDPSVTLGKNLTEANADLLAHMDAACTHSRLSDRRRADLAAAYGVAAPARPADRMLASPWALVSGSGHQDFLSSVQELMLCCTEDHLRQALFGPWVPNDEKYSLRLDTNDDRRYALMDRDPTASSNKPLTMWGANRLAFEALRFFPCLPDRGGMGVRGWRAAAGNWQDQCRVRWPIWEGPIEAAVVGALLGLRDLWIDEPVAHDRLRGLGIRVVMESRRVAVGQGANKKYNLLPGTPAWVSSQTREGVL